MLNQTRPLLHNRLASLVMAVLLTIGCSLPAWAQFEPPLKRQDTNAPKTVQIDDQTTKTKVMTIAVHAWAPWSGPDLQSMGPLPRLASEIYAQEGTQTRFRFMGWSKALDMLHNKEIDAAIVWVSADLRMDPFLVSAPLMRERAALYSLKGKPYSKHVDSIAKGRLAWSKNYVYEYDVYNKLQNKAFTPFPINSEAEGLQAVLDKKADFFIAPYGPVRATIATLDTRQQQSLDYVMLDNSFPSAFFLINAEADDARKTMEQFNTTLRRMRQDGRYDKIFANTP